jgi:hypothetical protein
MKERGCRAKEHGVSRDEANKCGVVVEPEAQALLAQSMSDLASNPIRRNELGYSGRTLVEKEFGWSAIVDRWLMELAIFRSPQDASARCGQ